MGGGGGELIATDESTIVTEPLLDAVVVQDGQNDGCFADPTSTNESNRSEALRETDDLLDQPATSKEGPRWRGWGLSRYARFKYKPLTRW